MNKWTKGLVYLGLSVIFFSIFVLIFYPTRFQTLTASKVTKIYFADNISPAHETLIREFNKQHQGQIKVVPVDLPFSKFSTNERKELLARSLRSKSDRIDVFAVDLIWVPRFARWAEPLNLSYPSPMLSDFIEAALKSCYYQNQLVAIPFYLDIGVMFYRRDILQTLPNFNELSKKLKESITWEEFLKVALKQSSPNKYAYLFAADNYEGLVCTFLELLHGQNQNLFQEDSINLCTAEAEYALKLLVDLVQKYLITPKDVINFDEYQSYLYALEHDVPFMRAWPGLKKQYFDLIPNSQKLRFLEPAALPHFDGFKPSAVFGGWNFMIPISSKKKKEALKFIKFAHQVENQKMIFEKSGFIPIMRQVYHDNAYMKKNPDLEYFQSLLETGFHRPFLVDYTKISDIVSYYTHLAIKGEIGVMQALKQATRLANSKRVLIR